jgi:DNA modification methylase
MIDSSRGVGRGTVFTPAGCLITSFPPDHDISEADFFSSSFLMWVDENPGISIVVAGRFPLLDAILPELMGERRETRQGAAPRSRAAKMGHIDRVVVAAADALAHVPDDCIDAWITSIPYESMKRYSDDPRDLGNSASADEFIAKLVPVISQWRRTMKQTGGLFLNFQPQSLGGVLSPTLWLLPQALVANGLFIVQELTIIKTNAMPQNDPRLVRRSVEKVFHAVRDPAAYRVFKPAILRPSYWAGRDRRKHKYSRDGADPGSVICPALERLRYMSEKDVLTAIIGEDGDTLAIAKTQNQITTHPAKMADEVARWLINYGSPPEGTVGDSFCGGGTSLTQARGLGRHVVGSDLNAQYVEQSREALSKVSFGEYLPLSAPPKSSDTGRPGPRAAAVRHNKPKKCPQCQNEFIPTTGWQKFCSGPCRYQSNNDRRRNHDDQAAEA